MSRISKKPSEATADWVDSTTCPPSVCGNIMPVHNHALRACRGGPARPHVVCGITLPDTESKASSFMFRIIGSLPLKIFGRAGHAPTRRCSTFVHSRAVSGHAPTRRCSSFVHSRAVSGHAPTRRCSTFVHSRAVSGHALRDDAHILCIRRSCQGAPLRNCVRLYVCEFLGLFLILFLISIGFYTVK